MAQGTRTNPRDPDMSGSAHDTIPRDAAPASRIKTVGIVGAGAMGGGIAQVAALAGYDVRLVDQRSGVAEQARGSVLRRLEKRVSQGRLSENTCETIAARLNAKDDLADLAPCDLIIEAIVEDLDIKRDLFTALAAMAGPDVILVSNTSSLPIGAIAAGNPQAECMAGLHFFNPVPVMKLVEVILGPDTRRNVLERLMDFARSLGHTPVQVRDTPGFLVNYGGRAFLTEGLALLQDSVAEPIQIDAVMRDCWGFSMGPFELMDLTGTDINLAVTEFIHQSSFGDPRLRSTFRHRYQFQTGHLGRKTGRGYYDYSDGSTRPSPDSTTDVLPARAVYLAENPGPEIADLVAGRAQILRQDDGECAILAAPLGEDCSAFCARTGLDSRRVVALDMSGSLATRVTLMTAPGVRKDIRDSMVAMFAQDRKVTLIADSPGFIGQRIIAMIANLGCEMSQRQLARPEDIDTAMRLGLNYPRGPLELADALGAGSVFTILGELQRLTGDDRYRPSSWLRRRVQLGLPIHQPD